MVRTRSRSSFEHEFPLFHALIAGDAARVPPLCTPQKAAKCGPGNLSAPMLALLLGRDEHLAQLLAAGAPLDAKLTLSSSDAEMRMWLTATQLTDSAVVRQEVRAVLKENLNQGTAH